VEHRHFFFRRAAVLFSFVRLSVRTTAHLFLGVDLVKDRKEESSILTEIRVRIMATEANDELVSQFLAFTGSADVERAQSYLEMSGGNLETAVGLFMEHTATGGGPGVAASPTLAVRAPDETRTMRLMDHEPHPMMPLMGALMEADDDDLMEAHMASAFSRAVDPRAAVNAAVAAAAADDDSDVDMDDSPPEAPTLGGLFAPPTHLIHKGGGFQGARSVAKDSRRWLLVNIQKDSEFSSHALNRDVWRDELVENLIREGFIFWQTVRTVVLHFLSYILYISLFLFFRWTTRPRVDCMPNDIQCKIILT
jgi:hypothetical protein